MWSAAVDEKDLQDNRYTVNMKPLINHTHRHTLTHTNANQKAAPHDSHTRFSRFSLTHFCLTERTCWQNPAERWSSSVSLKHMWTLEAMITLDWRLLGYYEWFLCLLSVWCSRVLQTIVKTDLTTRGLAATDWLSLTWRVEQSPGDGGIWPPIGQTCQRHVTALVHSDVLRHFIDDRRNWKRRAERHERRDVQIQVSSVRLTSWRTLIINSVFNEDVAEHQ